MNSSRIFSSGPFAGLIAAPKSSALSGAHGAPARVLKAYNDELRADVQTTTGQIYRDVEFGGPLLQRGGRGHGRYQGLRKHQVVWVDFAYANPGGAVITAVLSTVERRSVVQTIKDFFQKQRKLEVDEDFADFHESGYSALYQEDQIAYVDQTGSEVLRVDFAARELVLKQGWRLRVEGMSPAMSTIVAAAGITSSGSVAAAGGVSVTPGTPPVAGVLLTSQLIVAQDLVAASGNIAKLNSADIAGGQITGTTIRAGTVDLGMHTHGPTGTGPPV